MEKTIHIAGKEVRLKSTAATPLLYKAQFKSDYMKDLLKLAGLETLTEVSDENGKLDVKKLTDDDLNRIDMSVLYQYLWTLAKNADMSIADPITWFSGFDSLDLEEVLPEVSDMLTASLYTAKK